MSSPDGNLSGEGWRRGKREEEKVHLGRGKGMEASGYFDWGMLTFYQGRNHVFFCFFFTSTVKQRLHSHCHPRILIFFISSHFEHHTIKLQCLRFLKPFSNHIFSDFPIQYNREYSWMILLLLLVSRLYIPTVIEYQQPVYLLMQ